MQCVHFGLHLHTNILISLGMSDLPPSPSRPELTAALLSAPQLAESFLREAVSQADQSQLIFLSRVAQATGVLPADLDDIMQDHLVLAEDVGYHANRKRRASALLQGVEVFAEDVGLDVDKNRRASALLEQVVFAFKRTTSKKIEHVCVQKVYEAQALARNLKMSADLHNRLSEKINSLASLSSVEEAFAKFDKEQVPHNTTPHHTQ